MILTYIPFVDNNPTPSRTIDVPDSWLAQVRRCGCGEKLYHLIEAYTVPVLQEELACLGAPLVRIPYIEFKFRQLTYYFLWKVSQEYVKLYVVPGKLKLATSFIDEIVLKYKE